MSSTDSASPPYDDPNPPTVDASIVATAARVAAHADVTILRAALSREGMHAVAINLGPSASLIIRGQPGETGTMLRELADAADAAEAEHIGRTEADRTRQQAAEEVDQ